MSGNSCVKQVPGQEVDTGRVVWTHKTKSQKAVKVVSFSGLQF